MAAITMYFNTIEKIITPTKTELMMNISNKTDRNIDINLFFSIHVSAI
jgi:hypothetical protein